MPSPQRYTRIAVALHWIVAAVVFAQFALGWLMQEIAKQPPGPRASAFNVHKSIGLVILALMLARIAWRLSHPAPALPAMPRWQARAALGNHFLLYTLLVVMPLAGYLGSAFSGYPVRFFGIVLPSWAPKNEVVKQAMSEVHLIAAWLLAAAVVAHLAAVVKHAMVDRDGILARMGWKVVDRNHDEAGGGPQGGPPPVRSAETVGAGPEEADVVRQSGCRQLRSLF